MSLSLLLNTCQQCRQCMCQPLMKRMCQLCTCCICWTPALSRCLQGIARRFRSWTGRTGLHCTLGWAWVLELVLVLEQELVLELVVLLEVGLQWLLLRNNYLLLFHHQDVHLNLDPSTLFAHLIELHTCGIHQQISALQW